MARNRFRMSRYSAIEAFQRLDSIWYHEMCSVRTCNLFFKVIMSHDQLCVNEDIGRKDQSSDN